MMLHSAIHRDRLEQTAIKNEVMELDTHDHDSDSDGDDFSAKWRNGKRQRS